MLFLSTLVRATPRNIVSNSLWVRVRKREVFIEKDDNGECKVMHATVRTALKGKKIRNCIIKLYGKRTLNGRMQKGDKHPCWVHCDCEYFLYNVEVALSARGSSNVLTSNGNFPKIRNPRMKPYLCKHLLALVPHAIAMPPKMRRIQKISDKELSDMVKLMQPFVPQK